MIQADKSRWFEKLFAPYNTRLLRKGFHKVWVSGGMELESGKPTLYMANHISWWDGLLAFELNRSLLRQEVYALMSEEGLRSFRFFRKLGAYSIDRSSPSSIRSSLAYTSELLSRKGTSVWLFPQGDIRHQDARPLRLKPGVGLLLERLPDIQVVPVSFYNTFRLDQKPEAFIRIGPPWATAERRDLSRRRLVEEAEELLTRQADALRDTVIADEIEGFYPLTAGYSSTSTRFVRFFRRGGDVL